MNLRELQTSIANIIGKRAEAASKAEHEGRDT